MKNQVDEAFGFPVVLDRKQQFIGLAKGIIRRRIVVNPQWFAVPFRLQRALLAHEACHLIHRHLLIRLLVLPFPWLWKKVAVRQELEADMFAMECGLGVEMITAIRLQAKESDPKSCIHPLRAQRIEKLSRALREVLHVAA